MAGQQGQMGVMDELIQRQEPSFSHYGSCKLQSSYCKTIDLSILEKSNK